MPTNVDLKLEHIWADRVRERRTALRYSQRALGELCDVRQQTIWKIENAVITPRDSLKIRISEALGCRVDQLFPWEHQLRKGAA